jgi:putative phage-type endonuclease
MKEFPDCTIYYCEQRSEEWHDLRRGVLTASNFGPWLLAKGKVADGAREKAICKLISERAKCWQNPNFENAAMQRGTEMEPQAVDAFETATGNKLVQVGFCQSNHGWFGCSPDGLLEGESIGFEGKVPVPSTHIEYRRAGMLPDTYLYQVHGSMAVTGAEAWWFQSWSPGLAPLRILVERDDFTEKLKAALILFSEQYEEAWEQEIAANKR